MSMKPKDSVIIIGAGPVGLAAAAHLLARGLEPMVLEKGPTAGHAILEWGHVSVFTPWQYIVDKAVEELLKSTGWQFPVDDHMPTGRELVEEYLQPAATQTALTSRIIYRAEVLAVAKTDHSKSSSQARADVGYTVHYRDGEGVHQRLEAGAVIDASGTWFSPNPMGLDGLPVPGERENQDKIIYGIPDVLGGKRDEYVGKRTLVLGGGHSAINVALDLLALQKDAPDTRIHWGLRTNNLHKLLGGGINDKLPARGALGMAAKEAVDSGALTLMAPLKMDRITRTETGMRLDLEVDGEGISCEVDRIIVAAGFRPNLDMLRELRLDLDEVVEAPSVLAPLIDPNLHSCGTVKPHGFEELKHPDENFYIVGMKSYGRAPTFLMLTGYEQVRSIAAALVGDLDAARRVELVLPETGVCSTDFNAPEASCCAPESDADSGCCPPKKAPAASCCG